MAKKKSTKKASKKKSGGSGSGGGRKASAGAASTPTAEMRVVVLHGKDEYLRHLQTKKLRSDLEERFERLDVRRFEGESASVADVLDECRSMGLLQQHALVIVDQADRFVNEQTRPALERYASAPSEDATLLLRCDTWRKGNLDKAIASSGGGIVRCDEPSPGQAMQWAGVRAEKRYGATLERAAAEALIERLGADLGRIDAEVAKLAAMAGGAPITAELVREQVGMTREEEGWALQGEIMTGDPERALRTLERICASSRGAEAFVSYVLIDLARKLHLMASLVEAGSNPGSAAGKARFWGPARDHAMGLARRLRTSETRAMLDEALDRDVRLKSGLFNGRRAVEATTLRFARRLG